MKINKIVSGILVILFSFFHSNLTAQICASNYDNPWEWASHATWFTGDGVFINFPGGTGAPVITTKAINLGDNTNHAYEGTAAFSDNNGNLIGWSNGRKLWRDNGANGIEVADDMVAGNENGSVGERSSAVQGIVAVRHPNIPEKIFIFTSDDVLSSTIGPHYTVYDINTQTSTAPVRLQNDVGANYRGTEQIDATFHANGNDIWVVVRQSGRGTYNNFRSFYSYLITCNGLNPVPVKSEDVVPELGHTYTGGGGNFQAGMWSNDYGRGALKISWDGTKAATGNHITGGSDADEALMVFDFDNATGLLSNCIPFARVPGAWGWDNAYTNWGAAYDIEWAPNSEGLYVSSISGGGDLQWFNAAAGSSAAISSSGKMVYNSHRQFTDIKMGGDGNLYAPGTGSNLRQYVFTDINNGNGLTANNLPAGATVSLGLSNTFIPPIDYTELNGNPGTMDCTDPPVNLGVEWVCRGGSAEDTTVNGWSSDCGACITDAARGIFDPSIAGAGTHKVYYQRGTTCSQIDSLEITVTCNNVCEDTTLSNVIADVCVDQTADLTAYQVTSDAGTWSIVSTPAGSSPATITGGNTFDASNADAGVYRIRFTLDNAPFATCADSAERNITVTALPTISLGTGPICDGQTLTLDAGNAGATYQWSTGGVAGGTAQTEDVTTAGPHKVIVTDGTTGCIDSAETTVVVNANPDVSITPPTSACTNGAVETLVATPAGGNWYVNDVASTDQLDPTGLAATNHEIKYSYTDGNGCSDSDSVVITLNLPPTLDLGDNVAFCAGQSATLDAGPGWSDHAWSTGDNTRTTVVTSAGTYDVTVTDGNGCTAWDDIVVEEDTLPIPSINGAPIVCQDSATMITGVAGSGGTLSWADESPFVNPRRIDAAGTYWLIEEDGNGCVDSVSTTLTIEALPDLELGGPYGICLTQETQTLDASTGTAGEIYFWNGGTTDATLEVSTAGDYSVVVIAPSGCMAFDTATVNGFTPPSVDLGPDTFYCAGLDITLDAGAGFANYDWSPGSAQTLLVNSAGEYSVVITDANGCTATDTVDIAENELPTVDLGGALELCENDSITLDATHPDAATYLWTPNNEGTATIRVGSETETYGVTITDVDGCVFTTSRSITQEDLPVVDLGANDTICDDLTITLDAGSGTNQSYEWFLDGAVITGETSQTLVADSGTYVVSVTTPLGCETRDTIEIDNYQLPVVTLGGDYAYCEFDSVQLDAGNPTATFVWSPTNETTQSIWVTAQGTYTVTVTDTNGCINSDNSIITENPNPVVDLGANDSACVGLAITLDATIANEDTYLWSNGSTDAIYNLVGPDTLSVIATDANGCIGYDTIEIAALDSLDMSFLPEDHEVCEGAEAD